MLTITVVSQETGAEKRETGTRYLFHYSSIFHQPSFIFHQTSDVTHLSLWHDVDQLFYTCPYPVNGKSQ